MRDETIQTTDTIYDWVRNPENRAAWEAFAVRYHNRIKSWSLRNGLHESDADDVAQGILLLIRIKIQTYDQDKGRFRDWLKTVTYRACMDYFRKAKVRRYQELLDNVPTREDLERELDDQARTEAFRIALNEVRSNVTPRDWQIFNEMTFKKRPAEEIAKELEITKAAVHMAKHRVWQKVKAKTLELGMATAEMDLSND